MAELTVDATYGTALYEAAVEVEKTEQIREEACRVLEIFQQETDLRKFLDYPAIPAEEKKDVLRKIFEGKICEELLNFLFVLIDNRRMREYPRIVKAFQQLVDHREGVSYGILCSAVPLDQERIEKIESEVSKLMGSRIRLTNEVDESLIAGFKVLVDGKVIDATYKAKLREMTNQLNLS